jgi:hypothetical protein
MSFLFELFMRLFLKVTLASYPFCNIGMFLTCPFIPFYAFKLQALLNRFSSHHRIMVFLSDLRFPFCNYFASELLITCDSFTEQVAFSLSRHFLLLSQLDESLQTLLFFFSFCLGQCDFDWIIQFPHDSWTIVVKVRVGATGQLWTQISYTVRFLSSDWSLVLWHSWLHA